MGNTYLTSTKVMREIQRVFHNNLVFAKTIDYHYSDEFAREGAKIGSTLQIRKANQFEVRETMVMNVQEVVEEKQDLVVGTVRGVDMNFDSADLALSIDDFSKRWITPAMSKLATMVDLKLWEMARDVFSQVGTPGTTPATAYAVLQAGERLSDFASPDDLQRHLTINPAANAKIVDALKGLFNAKSQISEQFVKGRIADDILGFNWRQTQNVLRHTNGAFAGTVLIDEGGGVTEGDEVLGMDAFSDSAPTVKKGDVFTVANVYSVNPDSKQTNGVLQQFVVTANTTGSSNEITAVPVSPVMRATGARQTISALPADGAAVTFAGTTGQIYPLNLAYNKYAFAAAFVDLPLPKNQEWAIRKVIDGISMSMIKGFDIINYKFPCRIDVYFGQKCVRPEWACRLAG